MPPIQLPTASLRASREVRKLREAALPTDGETARRKIPLLS
jgi:hypothetical protein